MIAVIFELEPKASEKDTYFSIAAELKPLLEQAEGLISLERFQSLSNPEKYLSLSFWRDEDAVKFILGQMLEDNFGRAMNLTDGISFMWERPMTMGLLVIAVALIFLPSIREQLAAWRRRGVAEGD